MEAEVERQALALALVPVQAGEGAHGTKLPMRSSKRPIRPLTRSHNGQILGRCMCRCSQSSTSRMQGQRGAVGALAWAWALELCGRKGSMLRLLLRGPLRPFMGRASLVRKDATRSQEAAAPKVVVDKVDKDRGV